MRVTNITVENMKTPLGIDIKQPAFSWRIQSERKNVTQVCYEVRVNKEDGSLVWDSGKVSGDCCVQIIYQGSPLESLTRYYVEVYAEDNYGEIAGGKTWFETAFMSSAEWQASWIVPKQIPAYHEIPAADRESRRIRKKLEDISMQPAQYIRKNFYLKEQIASGRIYITAHGVYKMEINGRPVLDQELAPGNSSYPEYLFYQTYDITEYLRQGENIFGVTLADGWYCGKVGLTGDSCSYGDMLAAIFELHVKDSLGNKTVVYSDKSCVSSTGPIVYSDLFVGEKYDARLEKNFTGNSEGGDDWQPVNEADYSRDNLHAQYGAPVRIVKCFKPAAILKTPKGETVIDAGQVVAGRISMHVKGDAGTVVTLEHSEILDNSGNFMNNLHGRFSHQTDIYILKGEGEETYTPSFTYHGFRYIKVDGYPGSPTLSDFEIQVLSSDNASTVQFSCSEERINRLQQNIMWSQISNTLSIPTDCPQREKAGWTGDVQVFCRAAVMNMDVQSFFRRWLMSVRADQKNDGQIPIIVPHYPAYDMDRLHPGAGSQTSAGWGDVIIALPYAMYQAYGDRRILEENYESMQRWVEYIRKTAESEGTDTRNGLPQMEQEHLKYLWNSNFHYGDWLTPSVSVDLEKGTVDMHRSAEATKDIVPTCFYAYSTQTMAEISSILGKKEESRYYLELNGKVTDAFRKEYLDENGVLKSNLQGIFVLALKMQLIPENDIRKNVDRLVELIYENGTRLDTGFLSIPFLLQVLDRYGYQKLSYDILFQDKCPSWLYEIDRGATTVWEAWQAIMPDGTKTNVSYNHYAFGCVAEWMYQNIGGLRRLLPGYKRSCIAPVIEQRIRHASVSLDTPYGILKSSWKVCDGMIYMDVEIPANTEAIIILPGAAGKAVMENGYLTAVAANRKDGILHRGSGKFQFSYCCDI